MKYRFVRPTEATQYPSIGSLTETEQAEIIAEYKQQLDPAALEAECRELLGMRDRGELVQHSSFNRDPV